MANYTSKYTGEQIDERLGKTVFLFDYGEATYTEINEKFAEGALPVCIYNGKNHVYAYLYNSTLFFVNVSGRLSSTVYVDDNNTWGQTETTLQSASNLVTALSETSTDTEYPSAKAVYDALQNAGGGSGGSAKLYKHDVALSLIHSGGGGAISGTVYFTIYSGISTAYQYWSDIMAYIPISSDGSSSMAATGIFDEYDVCSVYLTSSTSSVLKLITVSEGAFTTSSTIYNSLTDTVTEIDLGGGGSASATQGHTVTVTNAEVEYINFYTDGTVEIKTAGTTGTFENVYAIRSGGVLNVTSGLVSSTTDPIYTPDTTYTSTFFKPITDCTISLSDPVGGGA